MDIQTIRIICGTIEAVTLGICGTVILNKINNMIMVERATDKVIKFLNHFLEEMKRY